LLLSIIIPTLNRYNDLENTLCNLNEQSYQDFEVVIIDQTDNPESERYLKRSKIKYFWSNDRSASGARNIGIKESKGDILLFLDDDIIIKNLDFIKNHIRHYSDELIPGIVGCIMEPDEIKRMTRHSWSYKKNIGWLFFPRNYGLPAMVGCGGSGNLSVRRTIAILVGGMDENYKKGAHREESDFCTRVVKKYGLFKYDPDADIVHIGSPLGGIRSWSSGADIVKKQQHFDGAFYFLIKNFKIRELPYHLISTFIFFFYNKKLLHKPHLFILTFYRMLKGVLFGLRYYKYPKYLVDELNAQV